MKQEKTTKELVEEFANTLNEYSYYEHYYLTIGIPKMISGKTGTKPVQREILDQLKKRLLSKAWHNLAHYVKLVKSNEWIGSDDEIEVSQFRKVSKATKSRKIQDSCKENQSCNVHSGKQTLKSIVKSRRSFDSDCPSEIKGYGGKNGLNTSDDYEEFPRNRHNATQNIAKPTDIMHSENAYLSGDDWWYSAMLRGASNSIEFKVAGVSYEGRQEVIRKLKAGDAVILLKDSNNKFDAYAVKVSDCYGSQIGWVPKNLSATVSNFIDSNGERLKVKILEILGSGVDGYNFGVKVLVCSDS